MALNYEIGSMVIDDLILKYKNEKINTSPAFQRHSAWKPSDRLRLISSILGNKPIPSIFLYMRDDEAGETIYDVIDGKQRIETILKYREPKKFKLLKKIEGKFKQDSEYHEVLSYSSLSGDQKIQFKNYKIAVIQVSGVYGDILDLFININSLGAPLKKSEIRNAKFIQGPWIKYINDMVKKKTINKKLVLLNEMFKKNKIIDRMSKEEFILELLISIFTEDVNDGKTILDRVLSDKSSKLNTKKKNEFIHTLEWINSIFTITDIQSSRLKNKTDFYSLFFVLSESYRKGVVVKDRTTNKTIREVILKFLNLVDLYNMNPRKKHDEFVIKYASTIARGTDQKQQRIERNNVIRLLLNNIPHKVRDKNRVFNELQKRILWNNIRNNPICPGKKCGGKELTWDDITVDHITAWINGGQTALKNGQLLCRQCNSSKKDM